MIKINSKIKYPGGVGYVVGTRSVHNRADNSNKLFYLIKHARFFKHPEETGVVQEVPAENVLTIENKAVD